MITKNKNPEKVTKLAVGSTATPAAGDLLVSGNVTVDSGGSLSAVDGDLTIQSSAASHQGLRLGSSYVAPTNNVGALEDATTALGLVSVRFTDAFFSGTVNAAGIAFSSQTDAAGMTATTLNHYEEGTWTPNPDVEGAGDATATVTSDGRYTRIGNRVFIEARLVLDAISSTSSSNAMEIKDLPFAANASNPGFLLKVNCSGLATAPGVVMIAHSVAGYLRIADDTGNSTQNASDHFQVGSVIWISGSYTV